jgi:hypothetical protein
VGGSEDELFGPLYALFQAAAHHPPNVNSSTFLGLVYGNIVRVQLLASPPFSLSSVSPASCAVCPFQFLVYYPVFFKFFCGLGSVCLGSMLVYPRHSCGNTVCRLFAHLLVCISQAGLEPLSGGAGALLFS